MRPVYQWGILLALVGLECVAVSDWKTRLRFSLGWRRNTAAAVSFFLTLLSLLMFLAPMIGRLSNLRSLRVFGDSYDLIPLFALLAAGLGFSIKGRARIAILSANLLLPLLWWASYVG